MKRFTILTQFGPGTVRNIVQNFGWMLASRGSAAVLSLIYIAITTRMLGVERYGRFALITAAAQLLSGLLAFQTWQIIVQYGVKYLDSQDKAPLTRLYRAAILLDIASVIIGTIVSAIILHFFADNLGLKPTLARATLIFNIIILVSARSTPIGIMRLRDKYPLAAAADSAMPVFRLIGAVLAAIIHPTLQGFLIAWAIAELLTAGVHWAALTRTGDWPLILQRVDKTERVLTDNPGILRYALTTNLSQSLYTTARQLPLFLVGGLSGTVAAGVFRLAMQLARALTTLSQMITRAAFPEIVRAVQNLGLNGIMTIIIRSAKMIFVAGAVVFIIVIIAGKPALILLGGQEFGAAYLILLWLTAAACIDLITVAFEPSITAADGAHLALFARVCSMIALIIAAFALSPIMGAEGVAAAVLASSAVMAILLGATLSSLARRERVTPAQQEKTE